MRPANFPKRLGKTRQRGSALIIGIFVITVMFLLAAALIRMSNDGDEALTLEVWSTRALAAANSGADVAMGKLYPLNGGTSSCANVPASWNVPAVVGFHGCSVNLSCTDYVSDGEHQYRLVSRAVCESGALRVSRSVEVSARGVD
ncbi:MSHA biogenesis protein MshP [Shewanella sp. JM162201]|uniref:MSHA biogenesis protein MshP n=1 Tax=Shewanella jiangmenensis TaxID=2837387 RepID=A0ABS5V2F4_9GAMM|nr:MSHA biogenesis protein MshP [Shewanella jiangmenensis]